MVECRGNVPCNGMQRSYAWAGGRGSGVSVFRRQEWAEAHEHACQVLSCLFWPPHKVRRSHSKTTTRGVVAHLQEYALFKSFTEVARLVESKGLQPMVQVGHGGGGRWGP